MLSIKHNEKAIQTERKLHPKTVSKWNHLWQNLHLEKGIFFAASPFI